MTKPISVSFDFRPAPGYDQTLLRLKTKDKKVIQAAAAITEMHQAQFLRTVLVQVATAIVQRHKGPIPAPKFGRTGKQKKYDIDLEGAFDE